MSASIVGVVCDLVAITLIAGIYFRRHQRRDLLLAYVALNVGILCVTATLTSATVGAGLGLGLFGILSIIRLRSDSITQEEIAYYFVALALGLLAGVAAGPPHLVPLLIGLLVLVVYVVDHPRVLSRARRQLLTLDSAIPHEAVLRAHIENRLGIDVRHLIVQELDFVRDMTVVDVRYRVPASPRIPASEARPADDLDLPPVAVFRPPTADGLIAPPIAQDNLHPNNVHQNHVHQNHVHPSPPPEGR
jgi:hypothetical protein